MTDKLSKKNLQTENVDKKNHCFLRAKNNVFATTFKKIKISKNFFLICKFFERLFFSEKSADFADFKCGIILYLIYFINVNQKNHQNIQLVSFFYIKIL